jgi:hypothetical protein
MAENRNALKNQRRDERKMSVKRSTWILVIKDFVVIFKLNKQIRILVGA